MHCANTGAGGNRRGTCATRLCAVLAIAVIGGGCQSIESTSLVGTVEQAGATLEDKGERRLFLEVAVPEPSWISQEESRRTSLMEATYQDDLRRGPIAFEVPTSFYLDLETFQRSNGQERALAPYLVMQLRQRQRISVKKKHQVTKKGLFSSKTEINVEEVPVWSLWRWLGEDSDPSQTERVTVLLPDELDTPGLFSSVSGTVDRDGRLRVSLAPWMEHTLKSGRDLVLQVSCPDRNLSAQVTVSRAAMLHYSKQRSAK